MWRIHRAGFWRSRPRPTAPRFNERRCAGSPKFYRKSTAGIPSGAMETCGPGSMDRPHAAKFFRLTSRRHMRIPKHSPTVVQIMSTISSR